MALALTFWKSPRRSLLPSAGASGLGALTAQALALVPLLVGLIFGALALPRSVAPEGVPAPLMDGRVLARVAADDDRRASRAAHAVLSSHVRAVGSAFRSFNAAEAAGRDAATISHTRDEILAAVRSLTDGDVEAVLDLRAFQMSVFLGELRAFERTGTASTELDQLGGTFVEAMRKVGWYEGHRLVMPEAARRVAFKLTWNRTLLLGEDRRFDVTLDETRSLYAFYFAHPHPSEAQRARFEAAMRAAPDAVACERAEAVARVDAAAWLLGKVNELGKVDPNYDVDLARAAALFLKRDYRASAVLYERWLDEHHAGIWTLRVRNNLRAALVRAEESIL